MSWDFDNDGNQLLDEVTDGLCAGYSVLVDALCYRGNGNYDKPNKKDRYRYKLIVPIVSNSNDFYSTDLFSGDAENAIKAKYGIYTYTRQWLIKVVAKVEADYSIDRFGNGYKEEKYGIYKLNVIT